MMKIPIKTAQYPMIYFHVFCSYQNKGSKFAKNIWYPMRTVQYPDNGKYG